MRLNKLQGEPPVHGVAFRIISNQDGAYEIYESRARYFRTPTHVRIATCPHREDALRLVAGLMLLRHAETIITDVTHEGTTP